jgi:hypothetical protein
MNPAEIVVNRIQRDGMGEVFNLLAEPVGNDLPPENSTKIK